ncbi:MAG: hypothetical protein JW827_06020 [Spirochaetes bacterium]|nr:hypothetical protein [Spirochaetota bacterium]
MQRIFTIIFSVLLLLTSISTLISQEIIVQKVVSIQAPVLADFEKKEDISKWIIGETSENSDKEKTGIKEFEGGPWSLAVPAEKKKWCLGAKTAFKTKGYNFMEVLPPVYSPQMYPDIQPLFAIPIPNPENERFIPIPGKCKSIDVWVAGRNYRYNLEIWIKDFNGFIYPLDMGKLNFPGWRNLSRDLPSYIPQEQKYLPAEKPLKFIKYVLRSDPDEKADRFYLYIDHMKVITDVYIQRYDGYDLKDNW